MAEWNREATVRPGDLIEWRMMGHTMVPLAQAAISGLSHDCSTWDELYEDDDGEHRNAPTSSNAPKPTKKAKTMASGNGPATVLSEVAIALSPGAEVVLRMNATAKAKPSVLQWYLKRGDYDCCTGLSGLTETFLRFPRQIDMGKYAEGGAVYHLYAIMVECDDHYLSYIRPEMEGDRGQWYRFDDREAGSAVCGVSNATAVDASFGGEEWLCVNYLYGPSAVLKRPRESRASMLLYLKDSELQQLLREPKLPKLCPELQMPLQRGEHLQAGSVELEAAAAAEAELLNDLHVEQLKEVKKKKAKQKKKQKEKERKHQVRPGEDSGSFEPVRDTDEREEDSEDDEEAPSEPPMEAVEKEVDSDEEGFEEVLRVARGKKRGSKSQSNSGNTLFAGQGEASGSRASSAGRAPPSQEEKNEEELLAPQPGPGQPSPEELPAEAEPQEPEQARARAPRGGPACLVVAFCDRSLSGTLHAGEDTRKRILPGLDPWIAQWLANLEGEDDYLLHGSESYATNHRHLNELHRLSAFQQVTTRVPPSYDGRSSWFAYEDAIDDWCDITELDADKHEDAFWIYDEENYSWFQRRFQGRRMKRGFKGRRKGKGKGGKGSSGKRFFKRKKGKSNLADDNPDTWQTTDGQWQDSQWQDQCWDDWSWYESEES
eukprot:s7598_g4.t1